MNNGTTFALSGRPGDRVTVAPHGDGGVSITVNDAQRVALAHLTAEETHAVVDELLVHLGASAPHADAMASTEPHASAPTSAEPAHEGEA
jgi:hypothetical protein